MPFSLFGQVQLADSRTGFSGTQGANNWRYGYWPDDGSYSTSEFATFDKYVGSWQRSSNYVPQITDAGQHPSTGIAAVRRWVASTGGSIRVVGTVQRPSKAGDGVNCQIYAKGILIWSLALNQMDGASHAFDVTAYGINSGDFLDFVLLSGNDESYDATNWQTKLYTSSTTAWSPNLPIGPSFTSAQKTAQRTAGANLLTNIRNASGTYTITPGDYRFSANWNLNPVLDGLHDLTLMAYGVTFWFDAPQIWGIEFRNCNNVQVKGLTLDYDPVPFCQGRITAINGNVASVELMPG